MPITKTGKSKDGLTQYRVRVNYTTINGEYKQIERTAYGKAEAQALERSLLQEYADSGESPERMTVRELYEEYIESISHDIRETTLDKKKRDMENIILPDLWNIRLDRLNTQILQKWKNSVGKKDVSTRTKHNYYSQLNAMLNYARKRMYIPQNPLSLIGQFKDAYFSTEREKLQYYTPEEFLAFLDVAKNRAEEKTTLSEWSYYVFFAIAGYAGMRKGEINALRWSDIDGNVIHVRRSISQKLKGEDRETPPKNKSSVRDLMIPLPLEEILEEHRQRQQQCEAWTTEFRVCGGDKCLRDTSIEKHNTKYAELAGLPHIRIHDYRHTHASFLVNEGINIQEIARRLGHSNVQETWNTYSHLYPREEERAISFLNRMVRSCSTCARSIEESDSPCHACKNHSKWTLNSR